MSTHASPEVSKFLNLLQGVRTNGSGWSARCPCRNDDNNPSLSIGEGRDGRVLVTCHRGIPCSVDQICESVGIKVADLMPPKDDGFEPKKPKLILQDTYDYRDADGNLLFQKQRFIDDGTGKKTFRQRRPDGRGGWEHSLGDTPKVLYNLPAVTNAIAHDQWVWVVEGEKDADTVNNLGYTATTMPGGAGKWLSIHTDALAGGKVVVIADNDEVGLEHARLVERELTRAGCTVKAFRPPAGHKDITDMIVAGVAVTELLPLHDTEPDTEPDTPTGGTDDEPVSPDFAAFAEIADAISHMAGDMSTPLHAKVTKAQMLLASALAGGKPEPLPAVNWYDFVHEDADDSYDWVIPGLLERTDRVIFVAAEGAGKTMMARQIAICTAAGLHPFTRARIPRIKTLTIDLENPTRIIRRKSRAIMDAAMSMSRERAKPDAHLVIKPSGLNLLRNEDRLRFEELVAEHRPDLLFIGPLYKSFIDPGGRSSESVATEMILFLDHIRETYRCAMWMEQHAPLGSAAGGRDLRPFGSAVWSRWPEFGLAMERDLTAHEPNVFKIKPFRGDRDERQWPTAVKWGEVLPFDAISYKTV